MALVTLVVWSIAALSAAPASAQQTGPPAHSEQERGPSAHLPIVGRLFANIGGDIRSGPVLDRSDDDLNASLSVGSRARVGLHHVLSRRFSMNAEAAIGALYFSPHPMAIDAPAEGRVAFDWSATVLARYMPIGPRSGWTIAGGPHYRNTHLADGTLLQFGVDARFGYTAWTDDERFFIVELGLHAPLIEGLSVSPQLVNGSERMSNSWYYPSATVGVQWAF